MIVKFTPRGTGRGSGPVGYLLGQNRDREGAELLRGDPDQTEALIDASNYAKRYTSGVLSFQEPVLDAATKARIMETFEQA
ncbi:mobilization relaxase, partial [Pseudidiomarina aestuarii]